MPRVSTFVSKGAIKTEPSSEQQNGTLVMSSVFSVIDL
jgi:hypothetical protein